MLKRHLIAASVLSGLLSFSVNAQVAQPSLSDLAQGEHRSQAHIERNRYRHPVETLNFFQLKPSDHVVEIWPGPSGWYTEILAPFLKAQGKYYAAHWPQNARVPFFNKSRAKFEQKLAKHPELYSAAVISDLLPPQALQIAPANSVDKVLTFRNVHNWLSQETEAEIFAAMYRALKPGGLLGVVEHRAKPNTSLAQMIKSGYVTEAKVMQLAQAAGFRLLAMSDINNNRLDNKKRAQGVWGLPPTLRGGDKSLLKVGESDRMTLLFRKPESPAN